LKTDIDSFVHCRLNHWKKLQDQTAFTMNR
jgi:hypothetical protein